MNAYFFSFSLLLIYEQQFFEVPVFRNVTLKCINEIGALELSREYDDKFVILHDMTMSSLRRIIPLETGVFPDLPWYLLTPRHSPSVRSN